MGHSRPGHMSFFFWQAGVIIKRIREQVGMCFEPRLGKKAAISAPFFWLKQVTRLAQLKRWRKVCWVKLQSHIEKAKNKKEFLLNQPNIHVREYTLLYYSFTLLSIFHWFLLDLPPSPLKNSWQNSRQQLKRLFGKF